MPNTGMEVGIGIAQGLNRAVQNLYNVRQAKLNLMRQEETFKQNKKIRDAQLKKLEIELGADGASPYKERLKLDNDYKKAALNLTNAKVRGAEREAAQKAEKFALAKLDFEAEMLKTLKKSKEYTGEGWFNVHDKEYVKSIDAYEKKLANDYLKTIGTINPSKVEGAAKVASDVIASTEQDDSGSIVGGAGESSIPWINNLGRGKRGSAAPATAVATQEKGAVAEKADPNILAAIKKLRETHGDERVAKDLKEKGIDPKIYGL